MERSLSEVMSRGKAWVLHVLVSRGVRWLERGRQAGEAGGARTLRAEGFRVKRDASGYPPGGGWPWRGSQPEGAVVDLAFLRVLIWIGPI